MSAILADNVINDLLLEAKVLPTNYISKLKPRKKSGFSYEHRELAVTGSKGHFFSVIIRRNSLDIMDFSIILRYRDETGLWYNLVRYNGKHRHTNHLEKEKLNGFHIHKATQRYQEKGLRIESYAELTEKYSSYQEALTAFLSDLNFKHTDGSSSLFQFGGS